jgi:hypothetical protein
VSVVAAGTSSSSSSSSSYPSYPSSSLASSLSSSSSVDACCRAAVAGIESLLHNNKEPEQVSMADLGWWSLAHVRIFHVPSPPVSAPDGDASSAAPSLMVMSAFRAALAEAKMMTTGCNDTGERAEGAEGAAKAAASQVAITLVPVVALPVPTPSPPGQLSPTSPLAHTTKQEGDGEFLMVCQVTAFDSAAYDTARWVSSSGS